MYNGTSEDMKELIILEAFENINPEMLTNKDDFEKRMC